ncbi:MAG TPA: diacylglycerol kinase [Candidatus Thiothrix moscowensis]|uniref:diacylglycerol kinase n=1 Tax=unclassified Thiothrix TaxID=2636184 RepID=UPI0025EC10E7|nr:MULTISPECIES: diacylglycerol kinase [unclassified Thiothrix]HRJ54403.1 diacylglycerol kinase [Candidatus Thiothrix moscowensis]HRJ94733.1 diacylglycerol kinase [Candidatus Thiothrix moscowensis]
MKNKFLGTGEAGYHPLRKIKTVFSGFQYAIKYDFSVTYKLVLSAIVLSLAFIFREWVDFLLLMTATVLVVMAELFNSAIEALCDFVEERHNEKIKVIKDIAAAAVGSAILLWVTVMVMEIWQLF